MPTWRCPHCGTPQAESSRCWVCKRSSTSCGTCRHFRRAIAGQLGFCGLDRLRQPLRGDELRGCWEGSVTAADPAAADHAPAARPHVGRSRIDFVPIESVAPVAPRVRADRARPAPSAPIAAPALAPGAALDPTAGFWGDEA